MNFVAESVSPLPTTPPFSIFNSTQEKRWQQKVLEGEGRGRVRKIEKIGIKKFSFDLKVKKEREVIIVDLLGILQWINVH